MAQNFPPVNKIFDDLDKFRDYCRYEGKVFNEADLYNDKALVWQQYQRQQNYLRLKAKGGKPFERRNKFNNRDKVKE